MKQTYSCPTWQTINMCMECYVSWFYVIQVRFTACWPFIYMSGVYYKKIWAPLRMIFYIFFHVFRFQITLVKQVLTVYMHFFFLSHYQDSSLLYSLGRSSRKLISAVHSKMWVLKMCMIWVFIYYDQYDLQGMPVQLAYPAYQQVSSVELTFLKGNSHGKFLLSIHLFEAFKVPSLKDKEKKILFIHC